MRRSERNCPDFEFPGRYIVDEARFSGGHERTCSAALHPHSSPEESNA